MLYLGEELTISTIAKLGKVSETTIHRRYAMGLRDKDLIKKVNKPRRVKYSNNKLYTFTELSKLTKISACTLRRRYNDGLRGTELYGKQHLSKGKVYKGINLTQEEVRAIYKLAHQSDITQYAIADQYGIHQSTVSDIKLGRRWNNLTKHTKNTTE